MISETSSVLSSRQIAGESSRGRLRNPHICPKNWKISLSSDRAGKYYSILKTAQLTHRRQTIGKEEIFSFLNNSEARKFTQKTASEDPTVLAHINQKIVRATNSQRRSSGTPQATRDSRGRNNSQSTRWGSDVSQETTGSLSQEQARVKRWRILHNA